MVFVYRSFLKTAALLLNCTVVEQRTVVHFLWSEGVRISEIYQRMLALCNKRISWLYKRVSLAPR